MLAPKAHGSSLGNHSALVSCPRVARMTWGVTERGGWSFIPMSLTYLGSLLQSSYLGNLNRSWALDLGRVKENI